MSLFQNDKDDDLTRPRSKRRRQCSTSESESESEDVNALHELQHEILNGGSQSSSATSFSENEEQNHVVDQWTQRTVEQWRHLPEPHRSEALRNVMKEIKVRDGKLHNCL